MSKEFNPAPHDKHAGDPTQAVEATKSRKSLRRAVRTHFRHLILLAKPNPSLQKIEVLPVDSLFFFLIGLRVRPAATSLGERACRAFPARVSERRLSIRSHYPRS